MAETDNLGCIERRRQAEEIFGKVKIRPQDTNHALLLSRRSSLYSTDPLLHPRAEQVNSWTLSDKILKVTPPDQIPTMKDAYIVDSEEKFCTMLKLLESTLELAIDIKTSFDDNYGGMISVVAISSYQHDFLIDPFIVREPLATFLANPDILLIIHGGDNKLIRLATELQIFPTAVFDAGKYYGLKNNCSPINHERLRELYGCKRYNSFTTTEKQLSKAADWRVRPLHPTLCRYAQEDSHFLIRIWNQIKMEGGKATIMAAITQTKKRLLKPILPHSVGGNPQKDLMTLDPRPSFKNKEFEVYDTLWYYRDRMARLLDQHPSLLMTTAAVAKLATAMPKTEEDVAEIIGSSSVLSPSGRRTALEIIQQGHSYFENLQLLQCHNCLKTGHPAWACSKPRDNKIAKVYFNLPGNEQKKTQQNRRRRAKVKENRRKKRALESQVQMQHMQQQQFTNLTYGLNFHNFINSPLTNPFRVPVPMPMLTGYHHHPNSNTIPQLKPKPKYLLPNPFPTHSSNHCDPRNLKTQRPAMINTNSFTNTRLAFVPNINLPIPLQMYQQRAQFHFGFGRPAFPPPGIQRLHHYPNNITNAPSCQFINPTLSMNNPNRVPLGVRPERRPGLRQGKQQFRMTNPNFISGSSTLVNPRYYAGGSAPTLLRSNLHLNHGDCVTDDAHNFSTSVSEVTTNKSKKPKTETNNQLSFGQETKADSNSRTQDAQSSTVSESPIDEKEGSKLPHLKQALSKQGFYTLGQGKKRNEKVFEEAFLPIPVTISEANKNTSGIATTNKCLITPKKTLRTKLLCKQSPRTGSPSGTNTQNPVPTRAGNSTTPEPASVTTTPRKRTRAVTSSSEEMDDIDNDNNFDMTNNQAQTKDKTDEISKTTIRILRILLKEEGLSPPEIENILNDPTSVREVHLLFIDAIKQMENNSNNPLSTENDSELIPIMYKGRSAISPNRVEQEADDDIPRKKLKGSVKTCKMNWDMNPVVVLKSIDKQLDAMDNVNKSLIKINPSPSKKRKRTSTSTSTSEKATEKAFKRGKKETSGNNVNSATSSFMEFDSDFDVNTSGIPSSSASSVSVSDCHNNILIRKNMNSFEDISTIQLVRQPFAFVENKAKMGILVHQPIPINIELQKVKIESDFLAACMTQVKSEPFDHHHLQHLEDDDDILSKTIY